METISGISQAEPAPRRWDVVSAVSHYLGAVLSVVGLFALLSPSLAAGKTWHVVSFSVFGGSLILLYLASGLYHSLPNPSRLRAAFRRVDHAMIYVLIAGTYTPVCLTALRGAWGFTILAIIWGLAGFGIAVKLAWFQIPRWVSSLSYILMGWLIVIASKPLAQALPPAALAWALAAGGFYTIGVLFYTLDKKRPSARWFNYHDLFHLFILGGSACFFVFMYRHILPLE